MMKQERAEKVIAASRGLANARTKKICAYIADFRYKREDKDGVWHEIVEDAKGVETPEFKLKKKLMKACLDIEIFLSKKSS